MVGTAGAGACSAANMLLQLRGSWIYERHTGLAVPRAVIELPLHSVMLSLLIPCFLQKQL